MNIRGFLRWQFEGWYRDLTLWGMVLGITAAIAAYFGCPKPIPFYMFWVGIAIVIFDLARCWFRFSYALYQMQQNELIRKLKEKEL